MKTIKITNATIEIDYDEDTGRIIDTVVSNEDGLPLRSKPFNISMTSPKKGGSGVMVTINPIGDGWKRYIVKP